MNKRNKKNKTSALEIFEYIFAICMVINLRSMWLHSPSYGFINSYRLIILMTIICIGCCILKSKVNKRELQRAIILCLLSFLLIVLHIFVAERYAVYDELSFLITTCIILFYYFICDQNGKSLYNTLSDVICVVAVISLFFYIFGSLFNVLHPTGTIYTTWTATGKERPVSTYYNLYFEPQTYGFSASGARIVRNTGIFTEAPMYSYLLIVSLLIELFIKKRTQKIRLLILIVSIISTFSTFGYVFAVVAFTFRFFFTHKTSSLKKILKMFISPVVIIVAIIAISNFVETKMGTLNGTTRIDDFRAGYLAWKENPLFGNGFGNNDAYIKYLSSFRINNIGISNAISMILVYGGLMIFVPYILLILSGIKTALNEKDPNRIVFTLLHGMILLLTVVPFQAIPLYILFECANHENKNLMMLSIKNEEGRC